MNLAKDPEIPHDNDYLDLVETPDVFDDEPLTDEVMRHAARSANPGLERALKYGIAASILFHLLLLAGLPQLANLTPTKALLKPGERVTQVRLIESPPPEAKPEPPPEQASAMSDRDHTAVKERLAKVPPGVRAPLGKMEPMEKRMASLMPPPAPEDYAKERQPEREREREPEPKAAPTAKSSDATPKHKEPAANNNNRKKLANRQPDLRPTPEDIARGLSAPNGSPDFFPDGELDEAVVDINTREERFFSYLLHLKHKIQGVWVYPSTAARAGIGGSLSVEFSIAKDGQLLYVNLLDSSGHAILDDSAMKAIRTAAPYFPFPTRLKAKRLKIRANFIYITGNSFRSIM